MADQLDDYLNDFLIQQTQPQPKPAMLISAAPENNITLNAGSTEMLQITSTGFFVRGVAVPVDANESMAVYNCFKEWLAWASLNR